MRHDADHAFDTASRFRYLITHDLFRKTGVHFSGSCFSFVQNCGARHSWRVQVVAANLELKNIAANRSCVGNGALKAADCGLPRGVCLSLFASRRVTRMMATLLRARFSFRHVSRLLGVAAALLTLSAVAGQRAEALSPINPGSAATGKAAANGLTIEVHGGHGGGRSGGFGGGLGGGRGFSGAAVHGGTVGTGPAVVAGAHRFSGHGFARRHRFGRVFVGGVYYDDYPYDYPYYDYPAAGPGFVAPPGCRLVGTVDGPRVVCRHRAARHYHAHRRHHHHRHHRA
jgi:hypothetical protein